MVRILEELQTLLVFYISCLSKQRQNLNWQWLSPLKSSHIYSNHKTLCRSVTAWGSTSILIPIIHKQLFRFTRFELLAFLSNAPLRIRRISLWAGSNHGGESEQSCIFYNLTAHSPQISTPSLRSTFRQVNRSLQTNQLPFHSSAFQSSYWIFPLPVQTYCSLRAAAHMLQAITHKGIRQRQKKSRQLHVYKMLYVVLLLMIKCFKARSVLLWQ